MRAGIDSSYSIVYSQPVTTCYTVNGLPQKVCHQTWRKKWRREKMGVKRNSNRFLTFDRFYWCSIRIFDAPPQFVGFSEKKKKRESVAMLQHVRPINRQTLYTTHNLRVSADFVLLFGRFGTQQVYLLDEGCDSVKPAWLPVDTHTCVCVRLLPDTIIIISPMRW